MDQTSNQASSSIKVVKFSSGEEVISLVMESETELLLSNPAKIVIYTSSNDEGHVVECLRLTSYLANIKEKEITVLRQYVMYVAEPHEDILNMYTSYIKFMEGVTEGITTAELDTKGDPAEVAWELFSDENFVEFIQDLYEEHAIDIDVSEEEIDDELDELWKEEVEKKEPKKAKKKRYKKEETKMPYNPEADIRDPKSWSDNPEDYLK
jgi:hypothetical protein